MVFKVIFINVLCDKMEADTKVHCVCVLYQCLLETVVNPKDKMGFADSNAPNLQQLTLYHCREKERESEIQGERERDCRIRANTLIIKEKHAKNEKRYSRRSWDAKDLLAIKKGIFYRKEKTIPGSGRGKKQLGGERTDEEKRRGEGRQGEGENIMVSKQL